MALSIYKSGQGYWTRTLTAVGAGTLVISGLAWLLPVISLPKAYQEDYLRYAQAGFAVVVFMAFAGLLWYLLNTPKIADFMIATEMEMKKVAWPTRQELFTFTIVVIAGTLFMALMLWGVDLGFFWFFTQIGILQA